MTHPNSDAHGPAMFTPGTTPCPECERRPARESRVVRCKTCGVQYTEPQYEPTDFYERRIFDGPTTVIPDRVKGSLGFDVASEVRAFDASGIRLLVMVTDGDVGNAHMGGAATTEERIDILRQVLAGLEKLQ